MNIPVEMILSTQDRFYLSTGNPPKVIYGTKMFYIEFMNMIQSEFHLTKEDINQLEPWTMIFNGSLIRCVLPQKALLLLAIA